MDLFIWSLFGLALIAKGITSDSVKVRWPKKYTMKATKTSLMANSIEDYEIWRTTSKSRIDYNHGLVKSIITKNKVFRMGVKYDIHPEAYMNQTANTACYYTIPSSITRYVPENILPDTYGLDIVGEEVMNDKNTTKFEHDLSLDDTRVKKTIWAVPVSSGKYWIPVRYEFIEYVISLGLKTDHDIWEFYGYSSKFSSSDIFNVEYECTNKTEEVTEDSDLMTKELMFIDPEQDHHVNHVFKAFKKNYDRHYADKEEHAFRKNIFKKNMRRVVSTNNKNLGYKLSINKFADRTPKEMARYKGLRRRSEGKKGTVPFPYTKNKLIELSNDLPKEVDLRLLGYVSPVKAQQDCGSCWAFGTTAAVEGALARVNGGRMKTLANQALIDCAWAYGGGGCNGGTDNEAYEWMTDYGLPTEAEYGSYLDRDGVCNIKNMTKTYPIRGYTDVTKLSVTALKIALINHGPLSVSVHASDAFMVYSSGIFYDIDCSQTDLDHEVALVGYGERYNETYWILKNSWGPNWGIDGFMLISAKDNVCGVATEPTYVVF